MLDLRIIFGAIVACISIIAIGVGLVLTNEALSVARSDRPDIRINVASPQPAPTAIKPPAPQIAHAPAMPAILATPPAQQRKAEPVTKAAAVPAAIVQPAPPPEPEPTRAAAHDPALPATEPPVRHATRPAAPAPALAPQIDATRSAAVGPLEPPPDITGTIRALSPEARANMRARSTDEDTIFPLFRLFVPGPFDGQKR